MPLALAWGKEEEGPAGVPDHSCGDNRQTSESRSEFVKPSFLFAQVLTTCLAGGPVFAAV